MGIFSVRTCHEGTAVVTRMVLYGPPVVLSVVIRPPIYLILVVITKVRKRTALGLKLTNAFTSNSKRPPMLP